jgi:hypothetical protein
VSLIVSRLADDPLTSISVLIEQSVELSEPEDLPTERDLYFELLELQPIRLSLSFERTDRLSGEKWVLALISLLFCTFRLSITDWNSETLWQS